MNSSEDSEYVFVLDPWGNWKYSFCYLGEWGVCGLQSVLSALFFMLINRGAFYSFRAYLFEKEVFFAVKTERVEAANKAENVGFDFFNSLLI